MTDEIEWVATCARHKWEFLHNVNQTRSLNNGRIRISLKGQYVCPHCGARKIGISGNVKQTGENHDTN